MSTIDESSIKNVTDEISSTLASSDEQSAERLQTLSLVHQARLSQLTRAAAAVTVRFGEGSPQAAAAQAAVSASQASAARIEAVNLQLNSPGPDVPAGGWVLHGRVFDDQGRPVGKQTVFLADAQGIYQRSYGFAYTDDTGYFVITAEGTAAVTAAEGEAATPPAAPDLYLEVANEKRQPVYRSDTAFGPTVDTATYVSIQLAAGGEPIGDPPRAIRGSAFPTAPRKAKNKGTTKSKPKPRGSTND